MAGRFYCLGGESKNSSPDIVLVVAIRQLNHIPLGKCPFYKVFWGNALVELVLNGRFSVKPGQSHLSPTDRNTILFRSSHGNEKVAREFLGRTDVRPFYDQETKADASWLSVYHHCLGSCHTHLFFFPGTKGL